MPDNRNEPEVLLIFDELPLADEETHRAVMQARMQMIREHAFFHNLAHIEVKTSEFEPSDFVGIPYLETDGYKTGMWGSPGIGKTYTFKEREAYNLREDAFYNRMLGLELTDPDAGLPEWQKRRNQSQRAKAELIAKLKRRKS